MRLRIAKIREKEREQELERERESTLPAVKTCHKAGTSKSVAL